MTNTVPFLYVNIIALCGYALMLTAFMAAKKTPEIRCFILTLIGCMCWTGGSVLMRLQVFPGVDFWFYVSIMSLFATPLLLYLFVCSFAHVKGYFLKCLWSVGTVIILALTARGVFLKPPQMVTLPGGGIGFTYAMSWPIVIPAVFCLFLALSIAKIFRDLIRARGIRTPGLMAIIVGILLVVLGNLLQLLPGNVFPWDTLSGILYAGMMMYSLYTKRMFRLTLLVSRSVVIFISALLCMLVAVYFVIPLELFLTDQIGISNSMSSGLVVMLFTCLMALVYILLKKLIDALFTREEQQGRLLKNFSHAVTQSLNTKAITELLAATIQGEIPVENVYICLRENDRFASRHNSSPLAPASFSIREDSPCIDFIREGDSCFVLSEFQSSPAYLAMWEEEKNLFGRLRLECILALKDSQEIVGLVLLSNKERGGRYTYNELSFLSTIGSIASIAVKNASLYEQVYREARIDALTGVYNFKFFSEKIQEDFEKCGNDCLALLYLNMDDFKLYNHLYGTAEGDRVLNLVAQILQQCVGQSGTVFRNSSKEFAVLLPGFDGRRAQVLAGELQRQISLINATPERRMYKDLTASCGICVSPHGASSPKELMENADLAVFNAKSMGKGNVVLFQGADRTQIRVSQRTFEIIQSGGTSSLGESSNAIFALTAAIDAKDHYTGQHSQNVAKYAAILATAAGLNDDQIRLVYAAGLLHDIGKISIPEHILNKNGRLTPEEIQIMNGHVNGSIEMMRHLPSMDYLIPAAVGHHERWDGRGYPRGIAGEDIPITARCLAVADAFDAMTTDRPYRKALSIEYAASQVEENAGTQFDPELARLFVRLIQTGEITLTK